jgi:predicted TIM-barrel fold metal-dependent hydrolase
LLYSGTLEAYQSIKFVLAHGGGTIPYLAHRIGLGHLLDAFPPLAAEPTGALLRRFHFEVAMCAGPTTLATLTGFADPHRILCGTDFPFMPREEVLAMVRCLAEAVGPDGTGLIDTIRQNGRHLGSATGFRTRTP